MGIVLKFPLERVSRTSSLPYKESHRAELLIFEGVQYSRQENDLKGNQQNLPVNITEPANLGT